MSRFYYPHDWEIFQRKRCAIKRVKDLSSMDRSIDNDLRDSLVTMINSLDTGYLTVAEVIIEKEYQDRKLMIPHYL